MELQDGEAGVSRQTAGDRPTIRFPLLSACRRTRVYLVTRRQAVNATRRLPGSTAPDAVQQDLRLLRSADKMRGCRKAARSQSTPLDGQALRHSHRRRKRMPVGQSSGAFRPGVSRDRGSEGASQAMPDVDAVMILESMQSSHVLWLLMPPLARTGSPEWSVRPDRMRRDQYWHAALRVAAAALRSSRFFLTLVRPVSLRKRR